MEPIFDICKICKKDVQRVTHPERVRVYCSMDCQVQEYRNKRIPKKCNHCGLEYTVSAAKDRFSRYCSVACYRKGSQKPREMIESLCELCNKTFTHRKLRYVPNKQFCSVKCSIKSRLSRRTSEDE